MVIRATTGGSSEPLVLYDENGNALWTTSTDDVTKHGIVVLNPDGSKVGGGGGGGGAVTIADGADVTLGAKADAAITDSTTTNTAVSFFKGLVKILADVWDSTNHRLKMDGSGVTQPVSGTFWQATQPVSGTVTANAGTNLNTSTLATVAKQPALGAAGTAATDVITIQGIAGMTKVLVTPDANAAVNVAQINGTAPTMGNGGSGTGVQRVTVASDSTGQIALATGTNSIGKLGSTNSAVDIGDVGVKSYTAPVSGQRAGSATAVQLANVPCKLVKVKAQYGNAGRVYLGVSTVTKSAPSTTDTTGGLELSAGEESGWMPLDNLNRLYIICTNAADSVTYLAMN